MSGPVGGGPMDGGQERADEPRAPLFVVKGDATPEEVAALVVALRVAGAGQPAPPADGARSEWSAHHRKVRASLAPGPGGWRSSATPR